MSCASRESADRCGLGRCRGISRRRLFHGGGAGVAIAAAWACLPPAAAATSVDAAVSGLLAGRTAVESPRLRLDVPLIFEFGTTVPLSVVVDSPMIEADHVRRVSVLAEGNPFPEVASLYFTPHNGRASASTRIRLNAGMQQVVAIAELSDGRAWIARRAVKVAISGCMAESEVVAGHAMPRPEPRLKAPTEARRDEIVELRTMISHRMETGLRFDASGSPIPRRIIHRMACLRDGETIFAADLTPAIAANAYLTFPVIAERSAVLAFAWREDGGGEYRASHALTVT